MDMRFIPLTQGKRAVVDDEDYEFLNQWKWHINRDTPSRMMGSRKNRKRQDMGRLLMNNPVGKVVDHKNRNRLDNRRANLRICTKKQNLANRGVNKNSTTGYKGVHFDSRHKSYNVVIKGKHIGSYKTLEEAAVVYDKKATELYGEFAYLNFL